MSCTDTLTYAVSLKAHEPVLSLTQVPPTALMAQGQTVRWAGEARQWDPKRPWAVTQMSLPTVSDATWLLCSGLPNPLTESGKGSSVSTAMFGLQTFSTELAQQQKFRSYTLKLEYIYKTIKPTVEGT